MSSCTSCGHESASTARFCSECGLPLVSPAKAGAEIVTGADKSHWLTSSESDDGAVRHPVAKRGVNQPWAVAAAGLILAAVAWNLFRAPTTEVEGLAGGLDAVSQSPPTTAAASVGNATGGGASLSTITADHPESAGVEVADLDPALRGYILYAQQGDRLLRIDLSSGEVDVREMRGHLLGAFERRLFVVNRDLGIDAWSLDDLDAEPVPVSAPAEPGHDLVAAMMTSGGVAHLTTAVFSSAADPELFMIRVDLLTGSEQRAPVSSFGSYGLVEVPGAGLFELSSQGFRPLVDGSVRFYGERLIIVEECDAPDRCRRYWFDRLTGQEIERPLLESSGGWLLGPGAAVAVTFGPGGRVFVDTETGETLPDLLGIESGREPTIPDDLTPDGRFLAAIDSTDSGDVQIHDLLHDVSWNVELNRRSRISKVVFVPEPGSGE